MAQMSIDMIKQEPMDPSEDDSNVDSSVPLPLSAEQTSDLRTEMDEPTQSYSDHLFPSNVPSMPELSLMEPLCNLESSPNKKSSPRNVLTLQEKVEVIKSSESTGKSQRQLAAEFKISKTQVMEILRNKETIRMALDENILNPDRKRLYIKKNRHKFPHLVNADKELSAKGAGASHKPAYVSTGNMSVFPSHDFNDLSLCYGSTNESKSRKESFEDTKPATEQSSNGIGKIISAVSLAVSENIATNIGDLKTECNTAKDNMHVENFTAKSEPCDTAEENEIKDDGKVDQVGQINSNTAELNSNPEQYVDSSQKSKSKKQALTTAKNKTAKKTNVSIEDKIRLIMTCKKKSQPQIAKEFGITQKDVFEILRDRDEIEEQYRLKRKCLSQSILQDIAFGASFAPEAVDSSHVDKVSNELYTQGIMDDTSGMAKQPEVTRQSSEQEKNPDDSSQLQEYLNQNWSAVEESEASNPKGKRKRSSISIEEKMLILQHKGGRSLRETAEAFGIGKTTVLDIFKRSEEITKAFYDDTMNPQRKKMRTWKSTELNYAKVDQAVYLWYRSMVEKGIFLSGPKVQKQAAALAQKLGMTKFKASNGWLAGFCKRHRVCFSNRRKPKAPEGENSNEVSGFVLPALPSESDTHLQNLEDFSFGNSNEEMSNDTEISDPKSAEAVESFNQEDNNELNRNDSTGSNNLEEYSVRAKRLGNNDLLKVFIKTEPIEQDNDHDSDYEQGGESSDDSIPEDEDRT